MSATIDPTKLELVRELTKADGFAVLPTARPDGTVQSSIVTARLGEHPKTGDPSIVFLCRGRTVKIRNMRLNPRATITFRNGSRWVTIEGDLTLVGPDDAAEGFTVDDVPALLRGIETALRGGNDDWAKFDKTMVEQRRAAAYISLDRIYTNPG
ncbi:MAG: pyridoxamine 5'-phosphate oxidase family protein [Chloroflexota bacterium]